MANLLEEKMFTNYNSSILREHTVKKYVFVFYRISKDYHSHNFNNYPFLAYILLRKNNLNHNYIILIIVEWWWNNNRILVKRAL